MKVYFAQYFNNDDGDGGASAVSETLNILNIICILIHAKFSFVS